MCNLQKRLICAAFRVLLQAMFMCLMAQRLKSQEKLITINKTNTMVKHIQRKQFSFTKASIKCL